MTGSATPLRLGLALLVLGGLGYCSHGYLTAERRIGALCGQIRPGMTMADLRQFAGRHGLRPPTRETGVNHLVEGRTFGRFGCHVTLENGRVVATEYRFVD